MASVIFENVSLRIPIFNKRLFSLKKNINLSTDLVGVKKGSENGNLYSEILSNITIKLCVRIITFLKTCIMHHFRGLIAKLLNTSFISSCEPSSMTVRMNPQTITPIAIHGTTVLTSIPHKELNTKVNPPIKTIELITIQRGPRTDLEYLNLISIQLSSKQLDKYMVKLLLNFII